MTPQTGTGRPRSARGRLRAPLLDPQLTAPLRTAIYYLALIVGDWLDRVGRQDEPVDPAWVRHGGLVRTTKETK